MPVGFASALVRRVLRFGGHLSGREDESFVRLRAKASEVRGKYIGKPVRKGNVTALEYVSLASRDPITVEATSRYASPSPLPLPRSQGGYFEPSIDPSQNRRMDTDAEYKALSALAERLEAMAAWQRIGVVYLFTELQPCASCESVIEQFEERFPLVSVVIKFDHPFP